MMVIHLLMLVCCDASGSLSHPLSINQARDGFCGNRCGVCKGKSESSGPIKNPNKQDHASGRDMTHSNKMSKALFP